MAMNSFEKWMGSLPAGYQLRDTDSWGTIWTRPSESGTWDIVREDELGELQRAFESLQQPDATGALRYGADMSGVTGGGPASVYGGDLRGEPVTRDGQKYARVAMGFDEAYGEPRRRPVYDQFGITRDDFMYDPAAGWLMPQDKFEAIKLPMAQATDDKNWYDALVMAPKIAGGIASGAMIGGAFPALDMAGAEIANTGLLSQLGVQHPFTMSGGTDAPWAVNPRNIPAGAMQTFASQTDPIAALEFLDTVGGGAGANAGAQALGFNGVHQALTSVNPSWLSAGGTVAAGLQKVGLTGLANTLTSGGGGNSGMWDSFLTDLVKPSTLIPAAGQIISAITGANAAGDALDAQLGATNAAIAEQRRQFDLTRSDFAPYRDAGTKAITSLSDQTVGPNAPLTRRFTMEDLDADPVYQASLRFGLDEGQKAIERRARATGTFGSGGTLKELQRYTTDYTGAKAGEAFNRFQTEGTNIYNKLAGVAGTGQTAANTVAQAGQNTANNVSQTLVGQGNARGAASIAQANAITGGINNLANFYQNQQVLNRLPVYTMS